MTVRLKLGSYRNVASVFAPGTVTPDGDGGYTQTPTALDPPTWRCSIEKASVRTAEKQFAATVVGQSAHIMRGRFHSGLVLGSVVTWIDRAGASHTGNVTDVVDTEGAGVESVILVSELTS